MNIYTFYNAGPYGTFEEGLVIEVDGKLIAIHDCGVVELKSPHNFDKKTKVEPKNILSALVQVCGNRIAGDFELQGEILPLINPSVLNDFNRKQENLKGDNVNGCSQ